MPVFRGYARNVLLPLKIADPLPTTAGAPDFPPGFSLKKQTLEFHDSLLERGLPLPTQEELSRFKAIQDIANEDDDDVVDVTFYDTNSTAQ